MPIRKKNSFLLSLRFCEIIFILPTFAHFFFNIHNYFSITFEFGMVEQVTQENGIKLILKNNGTMRIQVK